MYKTNPNYILNELSSLKDSLNAYVRSPDEVMKRVKVIDGSDQWFSTVDDAMRSQELMTVDQYCERAKRDCKIFLIHNNARGVQASLNASDDVHDSGHKYVSAQVDPTDVGQTRTAVSLMIDRLIGIVRQQAVRTDLQA